MCVSRSRKGRAWACLARLGATTLPPPLAVVVLRAPKYCSDPYDVRLQVVLRCQLIPLSITFKLGKIPEAVPVATAIILTSTTLAHERGGMCVERHVSWIGTGTGTADLCLPHPTAYSTLVFPVAQVVPVNSVFQSLLSSLSCVVLPDVNSWRIIFIFFWH
jgi:hypothetical protein